MPVTESAVTLSATPTLVGSERTRILLQSAQQTSTQIYLGGSTVSPSSGFPWTAGALGNKDAWLEFVLDRGEFLYAIASPTPITVWILTRS